MLDKRLPYHSILMRLDAEDALSIQAPSLPEGYRFCTYRPGDIAAWSRIVASVGEFSSEEKARAYFAEHFLPDEAELSRRLFFVMDARGNPCGTANAWYETHGGERNATLHWVSVTPGEQGKGLGRAITACALCAFPALEPGLPIYLHTQTWSYRAVGVYLSLGFYALKEANLPGHKNEYGAAVRAIAPYMRKELYEQLIHTAR